jgi:hypothetical protein
MSAMIVYKFKGKEGTGEAIVLAQTLEDAIKVLEPSVGEGVTIYLERQAPISKLKKPIVLLSNILPF